MHGWSFVRKESLAWGRSAIRVLPAQAGNDGACHHRPAQPSPFLTSLSQRTGKGTHQDLETQAQISAAQKWPKKAEMNPGSTAADQV